MPVKKMIEISSATPITLILIAHLKPAVVFRNQWARAREIARHSLIRTLLRAGD
jgi:hypothetical protein